MSDRSKIATRELARLLCALSHRHRVQIVEELRHGERDVSTLAELLEISTSRTSQHLSVLKAHHILRERREGRHVYYGLAACGLATWLAEGLNFVEAELTDSDRIHEAVEHTKHLWLDQDD